MFVMSETVIILGFGILTLLVLVVLYFVNRLVSLKRRIENAWRAVEDVMKMEIDLFEMMKEWIEKSLDHEENFLKQLLEMKQALGRVKEVGEGLVLIGECEKLMERFVGLESTYEYLGKSKDYVEIKKRCLDSQEKISYVMEGYDKGVRNYNDYKDQKGINLISKLVRFKDYDYYNE